MKICIPVSEDRGLESPVCGHFGSAPAFLLVDSDARSFRILENTNDHHEHGRCVPVAMLAAERVDAFVVGGIGAGALSKLLAMGAAVYRSAPVPASAALEALAAGSLRAVNPTDACAGHHD